MNPLITFEQRVSNGHATSLKPCKILHGRSSILQSHKPTITVQLQRSQNGHDFNLGPPYHAIYNDFAE
jgi:hypothetical protein